MDPQGFSVTYPKLTVKSHTMSMGKARSTKIVDPCLCGYATVQKHDSKVWTLMDPQKETGGMEEEM